MNCGYVMNLKNHVIIFGKCKMFWILFSLLFSGLIGGSVTCYGGTGVETGGPGAIYYLDEANTYDKVLQFITFFHANTYQFMSSQGNV